jgi:hypothetical protein
LYTFIHHDLWIYGLYWYVNIHVGDQNVVQAVKKIDDLHGKILKVQSVAADLPALILR